MIFATTLCLKCTSPVAVLHILGEQIEAAPASAGINGRLATFCTLTSHVYSIISFGLVAVSMPMVAIHYLHA
jgi:hypothetical protein